MSILLKVENLSRSFGGIHANSDISFDVKEGEILGVIGPNDLKVARDKALEIIDFVDLIEKRHHYAKELSTGQRKRLELARALATDPKLLLMDEVTGGVDQRTIPGLVELVLKLKKNGITVVTIEHNMKIIMDISDRILALNQGKRIAFDIPKNIKKVQFLIVSVV